MKSFYRRHFSTINHTISRRKGVAPFEAIRLDNISKDIMCYLFNDGSIETNQNMKTKSIILISSVGPNVHASSALYASLLTLSIWLCTSSLSLGAAGMVGLMIGGGLPWRLSDSGMEMRFVLNLVNSPSLMLSSNL